MPAKGHSTAPTWDGDVETLEDFFEDVKDLADHHKVSDSDTIIHNATRYASKKESGTWKILPEYTNKDYDAFVKKVVSLYPGASAEQLHTLGDLDAYVSKRSETPIASTTELSLYYREYMRITTYLLAKKRISEGERDRYFIKGFERDLHRLVKTRYNTAEPTHKPTDDYEYTKVRDTCEFVLSEAEADSPAAHFGSASAPATVKAEPTHLAVKTEVDLVAIIRDLQSQMALMTQQQTYQPQQPQPTQSQSNWPPRQPWAAAMAVPGPVTGSNATPLAAPLGYAPRLPLTCIFCGKPGEYVKECPITEEYVQAGKAVRNPAANYRLELPNGQPMPYVKDGTMKDQMDKFYATYPAAPPAAACTNAVFEQERPPHTSNMISVSLAPPVPTVYNEQDLMDVLQSINHVAYVEGQDPTAAIFEAAAEKVRRKAHHTDDPPTAPRQTTARPANLPPKPPKVTQPSVASVPIPAGPQYQFRAPIEETRLLAEVIDQALDTPITVTQRELLALAPEMRKAYREATTTCKVPIVPTAVGAPVQRAFIEEVADKGEPLLSANVTEACVYSVGAQAGGTPFFRCRVEGCEEMHPYPCAPVSESIRAIYPVFNKTHVIESLLDSGSEVTCMRRAVWEKLGVPVSENGKMTLTSADTHASPSLGIIRNLLLTVGGVDSYHQIIVMEHASYDVLLGRPFIKHLRCLDSEIADGGHHVSIANPINGDRITIPTAARKWTSPVGPGF